MFIHIIATIHDGMAITYALKTVITQENAKETTRYILTSLTINGELFRPQQLLGSGAYGSVHVFAHELRKIAVKTAQLPLSNRHRSWVNNEFTFIKALYPEDGFYHQDTYTISETHFIYFIIMPIFSGEPLSLVLRNATSKQEVITAISKSAQELDKLHKKYKIVHGDISGRNILIDKQNNYQVRFIDFYMASRMYEWARLLPYNCMQEFNVVAPERMSKPIPADATQDIYSFGALIIHAHATMNPKWVKEGNHYIPRESFYSNTLLIFAHLAHSTNPQSRPSLQALLQRISQESEIPKEPHYPIMPSAKDSIRISGSTVVEAHTKPEALLQTFRLGSSQLFLRLKFKNRDLNEKSYNEILFSQQLYNYPSKYYGIFQIPKQAPAIYKKYKKLIVTPFYPGRRLDKFLEQLTTEQDVLQALLVVCYELQHIHQQGFLHGNIKDSNILINGDLLCPSQWNVYFLNFEFGGFLDSALTTTTQETPPHWAPERTNSPQSTIPPATNQDMFSFFWVLNYIFNKNLKSFSDTPTKKIIDSNFTICTVASPENRPTLSYFIQQLKKRQKELSIPPSFSKTSALYLTGCQDTLFARKAALSCSTTLERPTSLNFTM